MCDSTSAVCKRDWLTSPSQNLLDMPLPFSKDRKSFDCLFGSTGIDYSFLFIRQEYVLNFLSQVAWILLATIEACRMHIIACPIGIDSSRSDNGTRALSNQPLVMSYLCSYVIFQWTPWLSAPLFLFQDENECCQVSKLQEYKRFSLGIFHFVEESVLNSFNLGSIYFRKQNTPSYEVKKSNFIAIILRIVHIHSPGPFEKMQVVDFAIQSCSIEEGRFVLSKLCTIGQMVAACGWNKPNDCWDPVSRSVVQSCTAPFLFPINFFH